MSPVFYPHILDSPVSPGRHLVPGPDEQAHLCGVGCADPAGVALPRPGHLLDLHEDQRTPPELRLRPTTNQRMLGAVEEGEERRGEDGQW